MSFAKIAEARAVKKIVVMIRARAFGISDGAYVLEGLADDIEAGLWKDIKLPKRGKAKKK